MSEKKQKEGGRMYSGFAVKRLWSGRSAVTLVELLLGLLIFSIVSTGLYGVFSGALKFDRVARGRYEYSRDVRLGFDMLSRDLENAFPYPQVIDNKTVSFEGSSSRIAFYIPEKTGLRRVEYFAGDLVRRNTTSVRHLSHVREIIEGMKKSQPQYLLRQSQALPDFWFKRMDKVSVMGIVGGVVRDGLMFRFGKIDGNGHLVFENQWRNDRLPDVVRVQCSFEHNGEAAVIDIFPVVKSFSGMDVL